jgi:hypothetical protein
MNKKYYKNLLVYYLLLTFVIVGQVFVSCKNESSSTAKNDVKILKIDDFHGLNFYNSKLEPNIQTKHISDVIHSMLIDLYCRNKSKTGRGTF